MEKHEARRLALEHAAKTHPGMSETTVLKAAEAYYQFLMGEEDDIKAAERFDDGFTGFVDKEATEDYGDKTVKP